MHDGLPICVRQKKQRRRRGCRRKKVLAETWGLKSFDEAAIKKLYLDLDNMRRANNANKL